jgi:hypothetical protein
MIPMILRPPPVPPYWVLYPEPERSQLEAAYRAEHAKYCAEMDRDLTIHLACAIGAFLAIAIELWMFA